MDGLDDAAAARTARGRWAPGRSGNPGGKKPGTRNRATLLRELLNDGDVEVAIQVLREKLKAGDGVAARFVLDRLFPKPRDRDIDLGLPGPEEGTTVADLLDRIVWLMAKGEITIDEAGRMARLVHQHGAVAAPARAGAEHESPAFDLQTAGAADVAAAPPRVANRHERRRAAALLRGVRGNPAAAA
jgi:hypothetical protein